MIIMVTATFSMDKFPEVLEVGKKRLEEPLPSFVKLLHSLAKADKDCGMRTYNIFEVENEKLADGYVTIAQRMEPYWKIEGYKYSVDIVTDGIAWIKERG